MKKSLTINSILMTFKTLFTMIFPLITFRYIAETLGVDNVGKYNYINSIISYFVLIGGLGINTYAIRQGSRIREDRLALSKFSSEMFSFNILACIVSYALLGILLLVSKDLLSNSALVWILSTQIIFTAIGVDWIYNINEDFLYTTIRTIVFQIISFVLIICCVEKETDLYIYAWVMMGTKIATSLFNYIYSRRYCKIGITFKINWKKHFKPVIILFLSTVAITIYVHSDITMLGAMTDDYTTGLYSASSKIYAMVKTILSAIILVTIPRLSYWLGKNRPDMFSGTAKRIYQMLLTFLIPAAVGLFLLQKEVIQLTAGNDFLAASDSLGVLSIALIFCFMAYFWGQCILVSLNKEKEVMIITIISAVVNIILNAIFIPMWGAVAAAFSTTIAELIAYIGTMIVGRKLVDLKGIYKEVIKIVIGCAVIAGAVIGLKFAIKNYILYLVVSIIVAVISYVLVEILLKNNAITTLINQVINRFFKKKKAVIESIIESNDVVDNDIDNETNNKELNEEANNAEQGEE